MCVNYRPTSRALLRERFGIDLGRDVAGEVWPGSPAPIVRRDTTGATSVDLAQFGLIPSWTTERTFGRRHAYNARSETVRTKPTFRDAWRKGQFCVVPMTAYFEPNWETGKAERWAIARADGVDFGAAGLWNEWIDRASGECVMSFTLLTLNVDDHPSLARFHGPEDEKRALALLEPSDYDAWLDGSSRDADRFLCTWPAERLSAAPAPLPPRRRQPASA